MKSSLLCAVSQEDRVLFLTGYSSCVKFSNCAVCVKTVLIESYRKRSNQENQLRGSVNKKVVNNQSTYTIAVPFDALCSEAVNESALWS